jgi:hypothetical protein
VLDGPANADLHRARGGDRVQVLQPAAAEERVQEVRRRHHGRVLAPLGLEHLAEEEIELPLGPEAADALVERPPVAGGALRQ